jgi:hypothetical protein
LFSIKTVNLPLPTCERKPWRLSQIKQKKTTEDNILKETVFVHEKKNKHVPVPWFKKSSVTCRCVYQPWVRSRINSENTKKLSVKNEDKTASSEHSYCTPVILFLK